MLLCGFGDLVVLIRFWCDGFNLCSEYQILLRFQFSSMVLQFSSASVCK